MASSRRQVNTMPTARMTPIPLVKFRRQTLERSTGQYDLARPKKLDLLCSTKKEANPLWRRLPPDGLALYQARLWQGLLDIATLELLSPTHLELPHKVRMRKFPRGFVTPGG